MQETSSKSIHIILSYPAFIQKHTNSITQPVCRGYKLLARLNIVKMQHIYYCINRTKCSCLWSAICKLFWCKIRGTQHANLH